MPPEAMPPPTPDALLELDARRCEEVEKRAADEAAAVRFELHPTRSLALRLYGNVRNAAAVQKALSSIGYPGSAGGGPSPGVG